MDEAMEWSSDDDRDHLFDSDEDSDLEYKSKKVTLLHPYKCCGSSFNIKQMEKMLRHSPETLNAKQWPAMPSNFDYEMPYPIEDAAMMAHVHCVKFLLEAGAKLDIRDKNNKTRGYSALQNVCLHSKASEKTKIEVMKLLFKYGVDPNDTSKQNKILMSYMLVNAIKKGKTDTVQLFLINNAVPEDMIITEDHKIVPVGLPENFPIYKALKKCKNECFKLLLFYGARSRNHFEFDDSFHSIPHYIIQRYQYCKRGTKDVVEALEVFQEFGGDLWTEEIEVLPCYKSRLNENALEFLLRSPNLCIKYPGLAPKLEEMMSTPRSLKNICRVAVRKAMGRKMWKHISELEVAPEVKEFLHFGVKRIEDYKTDF